MIDNKEDILASGSKEAREICLKIIEHALESIDPASEMIKNVLLQDGKLKIFNRSLILGDMGDIFVVGAGKASYTMAKEVESILSDRISGGVVVTKYGYQEKPLERIDVLEAGHPIPDEKGEEAGKEILRISREAGEGDLILNLISGGGSALLCAPVPEVSLDEMQKTTDHLVASGATINEINAVRKHLSRVKGGRLAKSAHPARCLSLIVSDVVGDPLDIIASGPTVPDTSTFADAHAVLKNYSLLEKIPESVRRYLSDGVKGKVEETPKEEDFRDMDVDNIIISNNDRVTEAAANKGEELGLNSLILSRMIEGESREAGIVMSGIIKDILRTDTPLSSPALIVSGGETTVSLGDKRGEGGPNQEFVLGAATKISGLEDVVVAAVDTDGTDGPTDIAGGIVDGMTAENLSEKGLDLLTALREHDSKKALESINCSIHTGSTGTNVNDLRIAVVL